MTAAPTPAVDVDETDAGEIGATAAAPQSGLARLRARRAEAAKELYLDVPVPRLSPPVYVRFTPVTSAAQQKAEQRFKNYKGDDKFLRQNASIMAQFCVGIWENDHEGTPVGLNGASDPAAWPKFDPEFAAGLGLAPDAGAVATVLALYLTDGDVMSVGFRLGEWSGFTGEQLLEVEQGN